MMLVGSFWDQEDIYGADGRLQSNQAERHRQRQGLPGHRPLESRAGEQGDGSTLGPLQFGSDTGLYFRREILRPFLDHYLKDGAPKADIPPVTMFETGTNIWRRLPGWPAGCASGCTIRPTPLYLEAGLKLGFCAAGCRRGGVRRICLRPCQTRALPFRGPFGPWATTKITRGPIGWWKTSGKPPAARTYLHSFLTSSPTPMKISGQPVANLVASTSGTDADWVVKLIDVYPDEVAGQPKLGGYQLMVSADIFRGRYRESLAIPKAIAADKPLLYRFALPTVNHVFLPGHRIMVQIQSSWFPLYDRNPQTFVPNIFWAKPERLPQGHAAGLPRARPLQLH